MVNKYCVILGNGFDDIEAISMINLLRRANLNLHIYGVGNTKIESFTKINYTTEFLFNTKTDINIDLYNGLLLPGGPGVAELFKNNELIELIKLFNSQKKTIYAICGAPVLLELAGILHNKKYTCLPAVSSMIKSGTRLDQKVVVDENIITSMALGTSLHGALKLLEVLTSAEKKDEIMKNYYIELA